ncbi:MAG: HD domain-containing protein [Desulfobacterales bacterium]|nr:HD domain-containing protein [Desulfobacterales bacterium]
MALATEYFNDGSLFFVIDPKSIDPDHLAGFALYERQPHRGNQYRFRCLLKDTRSIPRDRLVRLLHSWDRVYMHTAQRRAYRDYVKENLEFILNHDQVAPGHKSRALVVSASDLIQESFRVDLTRDAEAQGMLKNITQFITTVVDFISDVDSIQGLALLVGHDYDTHTHSIKVGWLLALFINNNRDLFPGVDSLELRKLIIQATAAGFFHDIGKIKIPKNVINKPGKLNNLEYVLIQSHAAYSIGLLFKTQLSRKFLEIILYHHENQDGSGYPCGLKGEEIPLMARICHIVDVFDALTSRRSYKKAKTPFEALRIMSGENPYVDALHKFEAEAKENRRVPLVTVVRDDYEAKLKRLREREMLEEEARKRVKARIQLRDKGMSHCFDRELLRRFIKTMNRSEVFEFSSLI